MGDPVVLVIKTTYKNSMSFSPKAEEKIRNADLLMVECKRTGEFLAELDPDEVLDRGEHVYLRDRYGDVRRSYFKVYRFGEAS